MTRAEARSQVSYRLHDRTDITTTKLDQWLNEALIDLCTRRIQVRSLEGIGAAPVTAIVGGYVYNKPAGAFSIDYLHDPVNGRTLTRMEGGFSEWLSARNSNPPNGTSSQFVERGNFFVVMPAPASALTYWVPYTYDYPTWGPDDANIPSIESEWDYGLKLVALEHGARDLNMDESAVQFAIEFEDWLSKRDTNVKRTTRTNIPQRGMSPATASRRNIKTGV